MTNDTRDFDPIDDLDLAFPDTNDDEDSDEPFDPLRAILDILLANALGDTDLNKLTRHGSVCLVVATGSEDLVQPVSQVLEDKGDWDFQVSRTSEKLRKRDDYVRDAVIGTLISGGCVLGVASRFELLPDFVLSAADLKITLPRLAPSVVADVIEKMTGTPVEVPAGIAGLSFDEISLCLRRGDSAEDCLARLERVAKSTRRITPIPDDTPPIEALHGYGDAMVWAANLVEDLEAWRRGEIPFDDIDRAVVLSSEPGLGKSSFVRSLARSARLPLVATSVADWFAATDGHLGAVIKEIDKVFSIASSAAPAILFLDELDAVPNRATLDGRNTDYWLPVITYLLTNLDSAVSGRNDHLVVLGATNHGDRIDTALTRPGRLNRIVRIGHPDAEALAGILRQHLGSDLAGEPIDEAAGLAVGGTGADVVQWVRAARRKARTARRPMRMGDLIDAIAPADRRPRELVERIAAHEAGHAVVAHLLGVGRIGLVSVQPSGTMGGMTEIEHSGIVPTRADAEKMVMQHLGGRAAEEVLFGDPGTGAGGMEGSDLASATRLLGILHLGMGLGEDIRFRAGVENVLSILAIDHKAAAAVEADLRRLYDRTLGLVRANAHLVRAVAEALVKRRRLDAAAFLGIVEHHRAGPLPKEPRHG